MDDATGPATAGPPDGKRRGHRGRTVKEAKIVLSDWSTIDCVLKDLTKEGARLAIPAVMSLPEEFRVLIVSAGTLTPARLAWQRGELAGVAFTGPAQPAPPRRY